MARIAGHPDDEFDRWIAEIEERVAALERRAPRYFVVEGTRSDLPGGRGPRARFGELSDGDFGAERWTSTGTRTKATFS